jgi:hypothetical protein
MKVASYHKGTVYFEVMILMLLCALWATKCLHTEPGEQITRCKDKGILRSLIIVVSTCRVHKDELQCVSQRTHTLTCIAEGSRQLCNMLQIEVVVALCLL